MRQGACIAYMQNREVRMKKYKAAPTSSITSNCYDADYKTISGCPAYYLHVAPSKMYFNP